MQPKDELITSLFNEGRAQRAIARLTGLSQPGVRKRLIRLGLITSKPRSDNSPAPDNQGATPAELEASVSLSRTDKGDQDTPPPAVGDNCTRTDNSSAGKNDNRESQGVITSDAGRGDTPQAPDNCLFARSKPASKLLEEAAAIVLSLMNPPLVDFFKERCQQLGAKSWQVICAIIHRSCGLRQLDYYKDLDERKQEVLCQNCGHDIPNARIGQLYCCEKCSAYDQGSKVVQFGQHSEECLIAGQPWQR